MEKTLGMHFQNWLIRNKINAYDPVFVDAVDHMVENEMRRRQESLRETSSATTVSSLDPTSVDARTAA